MKSMKRMGSLLLAVLLALGLLTGVAATFEPTIDTADEENSLKAAGSSLKTAIGSANAETDGELELKAPIRSSGNFKNTIAILHSQGEVKIDADTTLKRAYDGYTNYANELLVRSGTTLTIAGTVDGRKSDGDTSKNSLCIQIEKDDSASDANLTLENSAKLNNCKIELRSGAKLTIKGNPALTNVSWALAGMGDGAIVFKKTDGETVSSFIGAPEVNGKNATHIGAGAFAADCKADKGTVVLTASNLPDCAELLLLKEGKDGSASGNYTTGTEDNTKDTWTFSNLPKGKYTVYVRLRDNTDANSYTETANTLTLYNSETAKVETTSAVSGDKAGILAGSTKALFTVANPDGFGFAAEIGTAGLTDMVALSADGTTVSALKPFAERGVAFRFTFTFPDKTTKVVEKTLQLTGVDPVTAPDSKSVYINTRTKLFTITAPSGYTLGLTSSNSDVVVNPSDAEYITATKAMSAKNVKFTFTFTNNADNTKGFTVEKTVKLTATVKQTTFPIAVYIGKTNLAAGEVTQLSVPNGIRMAYTGSSNPEVCFVDGAGKVTARRPGTAILYAFTSGGGQGSVQVIVRASNTAVYATTTTLTEGESIQLSVPYGWITAASSSNESILSVTNSGKVTARRPGSATIYVSTSGGLGGTLPMTAVAKPLTVSGLTSLKVGQTGMLRIDSGETIQRVTCSNSSVLRATNYGSYTARAAGTAVLTVTSISGRTGSLTVAVGTPAPDTLGTKTVSVGKSLQLAVPGRSIRAAYADDSSIASVTAGGRVTGRSAGTTTVYIITNEDERVSVTIQVKGSAVPATRYKTLKCDQASTLRISGKRIVGASLEEDNGTLSVTNRGKITALNEGVDTVLLVTSDNRVYRVEVTVTSRRGSVDCASNVRVAMRSAARGTASIRAKLRDGQSLTILGRSGSYYRVEARVGGTEYVGYVLRRYVDKY